MKRRMGWSVFVMVMIGAMTALGVCPPGAIASDSELLTGPFGSIAIEACVTRSGGQDTYTYRLSYLGGGLTPPCGLLLSGEGTFDTVAVTSPAGWASDTFDTYDCSTWWSWVDLSYGASGTGFVHGHTLTMSVTVDGETIPTTVPAAIAICGKSEVPFGILGPSSADASRFEGEGNRILVLGGAEIQTIPRCEPSWVSHGFGGEDLTPETAIFRLTIDGVPIPLTPEVLCVPSHELGIQLAEVFWFVQFPADYFDVGVYEVTGMWESAPSTAFPSGLTFDRTITLVVEACAPDPLPLPDLSVRIDAVHRVCGWSPSQQYECTSTVDIVVINEGLAKSETTGLTVDADHARGITGIPALAPGEAYKATVTITTGSTPGQQACPLIATATVDFGRQIEELDEKNNTATFEMKCP